MRNYPKIIGNRKKRIERRLDVRREVHRRDVGSPVMSASNIHYEIAEKAQGIGYGGIGAIHQMAQGIGLPKEIDGRLDLLKLYAPYHESDHVLNIAYILSVVSPCLALPQHVAPTAFCHPELLEGSPWLCST